ncbi:MAG: CHAT domain-containing protein [Microcoleaceae cyanobacterium]
MGLPQIVWQFCKKVVQSIVNRSIVSRNIVNQYLYGMGRRSFYRRRFSILVAICFLLTIGLRPVVATVVAQSATIEQAQDRYRARDFQVAVDLWQQLARQFSTKGDRLNQAMALSNLSLTYQQLGEWEAAATAIDQSLGLLNPLAESSDQQRILAQTLDIQGRFYSETGQEQKAVETWQRAADLYQDNQNRASLSQNLMNQAQVLQNMGLYPRVCRTLLQSLEIEFSLNQGCNLTESVLQQLADVPDSALKFEGLRRLGNIQRITGALSQPRVLGVLASEATEESVRADLRPDSKSLLTASLQVAERLNNPQAVAVAHLSLGNTERAIAKRDYLREVNDGDPHLAKQAKYQNYIEKLEQQALRQYQLAATQATSPSTKLQAQLNQLSLSTESYDFVLNDPEAFSDFSTRSQVLTEAARWKSLEKTVADLPASRSNLYEKVNYADSLIRLYEISNSSQMPPQLQTELQTQEPTQAEIEGMLQTALAQSQNLVDRKAEAHSLGTLGSFYEKLGNLDKAAAKPETAVKQWAMAEKFTTAALEIAPAYTSPDIAYQLSWQLGRVRDAQRDPNSSADLKRTIAAYQNSFETLQALRSDLVAINPEVQFSFRESVEPVYRQLVDLQLQLAEQLQADGNEPELQVQMQAVRQVIESLQVAELNNFFRDACVDANPRLIDRVAQESKTAAVIYPIVLPDRMDVIVSLPTDPDPTFKLYKTSVKERNLNETVRDLYSFLANQRAGFKTGSKQVYDWLIRDIEPELAANQVDTLVFVLDGILRKIPMAALYDGEQYLVEKYTIALTPGLQLLNPQPISRQDLKALLGGASQAESFTAENLNELPGVDEELQTISTILDEPETRQNEQFTRENLRQLLNKVPFPVVHLATHGQFSSDKDETFILDFNGRINAEDFDNLLRKPDEKNPIELLVLSACETAEGDDQAALGLAGIAIRAGARSTVASLWNVSDNSTARLMADFYAQLADPQRQANKAQALQIAQEELLSDPATQHPYYWAPFVLVGNWQ